MLRFLLIANKQGQTRLAKNFVDDDKTVEERYMFHAEVVRKCIARREQQCSFIEYQNIKIIYRRYASLFFIVGAEQIANELEVLEFIQSAVEALNEYFRDVCELDILFNLERVHFIIDELVFAGHVVEIPRQIALAYVCMLDVAQL
eukprot:Amastigsp_a2530_43.p3 type:complete len:146 gc:universal Amastigsp_a2530_43:29-466(+)